MAMIGCAVAALLKKRDLLESNKMEIQPNLF
jgi:hypothetical protein